MPTLEFAVRLTRALGLAPYDYIPSESPGRRGKYALNGRYRCAGMAALAALNVAKVWVSAAGALVLAGDDDGRAVLRVVGFISPALAMFRSCVFLPLLWWRQQPLLLQVLNSDLFRGLPAALPRRNAALPVLAAVTYFLGLTIGSTYQRLCAKQGAVHILAAQLLMSVVHVNAALLAFLLTCVSAAVDAVNEPLREMAKDAPVAADGVVALRAKHKEAVEATERLGSAFGWAILVVFLGELCWIAKMSFYVVTGPAESPLQTLAQLMDIMKSVIFYGITTAVAQQLTTQANYTTLSLIHSVRNLRRSLSNESKQELSEFSKQICQQPLELSVNTIIVLDFSFFLQAFGVAATYVVVLVQFHQSAMG